MPWRARRRSTNALEKSGDGGKYSSKNNNNFGRPAEFDLASDRVDMAVESESDETDDEEDERTEPAAAVGASPTQTSSWAVAAAAGTVDMDETEIDQSPLEVEEDEEEAAVVAGKRESNNWRRRLIRRRRGGWRYASLAQLLTAFCGRTSSHGIPHIGASPSYVGKVFWAVAFLFCCVFFGLQTYFTIHHFLQYRTSMEMNLRFEPAPFPAVTVCNLNPFKYSLVRRIKEVAQVLDEHKNAVKKSEEEADGAPAERRRRKKRRAVLLPLMAYCNCTRGDADECRLLVERADIEAAAADNSSWSSVCICVSIRGKLWPCYSESVWTEERCRKCSPLSNTCSHPQSMFSNATNGSPFYFFAFLRSQREDDLPNLPTDEGHFPVFDKRRRNQDCLCQTVSNFCLVKPPSVQWWRPFETATTEPTSTIPPNTRDAYGLEDRKYIGSLTTRTNENMFITVAHLPEEERIRLSYQLNEFVRSCSFNSYDCHIDERDFRLHLDLTQGNCYTFNFNNSVERKNSRAGPMYGRRRFSGLRLLLNVNQSDYLPVTEAAGIRLVVHDQIEEPFPDTFGYNAPVGFISSFGLKMSVQQSIRRHGPPYGICVEDYIPDPYIYDEYSTEKCHCGDAKFPLNRGANNRYCNSTNQVERACLANLTSSIGSFHHLREQANCECQQPCNENVFRTAYSAAAFPAENYMIGVGLLAECKRAGIERAERDQCHEYYRRNTAFINVFYEQLNYEYLNETPVYTVSNLMADFGGNIGLWIGFSVITIIEYGELVLELVYHLYHRRQQRRRKRRAKQQQKDTQFASNQLLYEFALNN